MSGQRNTLSSRETKDSREFQDFLQKLTKRVRTLRGDLSLEETGTRSQIRYQRIWELEQGLANPQLSTLFRVATGLGVSVSELLNTSEINLKDEG